MKALSPATLLPFTLTPIGEVDSPLHTLADGCDYRSESRIVLFPELRAGLVGVDQAAQQKANQEPHLEPPDGLVGSNPANTLDGSADARDQV